MLTAWSMILQVNHLQPLSGNKSKEDRNLDLIGFLSLFSCFEYVLNTIALKIDIICESFGQSLPLFFRYMGIDIHSCMDISVLVERIASLRLSDGLYSLYLANLE